MLRKIIPLMVVVTLFGCSKGVDFKKHMSDVIAIQTAYLATLQTVKTGDDFTKNVRDSVEKTGSIVAVIQKDEGKYASLKTQIQSGTVPQDLMTEYTSFNGNIAKIEADSRAMIAKLKLDKFIEYEVNDFVTNLRSAALQQ